LKREGEGGGAPPILKKSLVRIGELMQKHHLGGRKVSREGELQMVERNRNGRAEIVS